MTAERHECQSDAGVDLVQLVHYLASISRRSTNQIVKKIDIRN